MATIKGALLIIQREDPGNPGQWLNLCGADNVTVTIQNATTEEEKVPCTDRAGVVQTIVTYGAQKISFSQGGLFDDDPQGTYLADAAVNQTVLTDLRAFVPGYGYIEAEGWYVGSSSFEGAVSGGSMKNNNDVVASGAITFTAV